MPTSSDRVIGYLGPPSDHLDALREVAAAAGRAVVHLPDSVSAGCYRRATRLGKWTARASRAAAQIRGTRAGGFLRDTLAAIDAGNVSAVLAYWGTNPLADLRALRAARPKLPLLLSALCHPTALSPRRIAAQNWVMRRAGRFLDGVVYPSEVMADYFRRRVFTRGGPPGVVARPCWPASWQAAEPDPPPTETPAIIFMGRMDGGQASDDVRGSIRELTSAGVNVHHARGRDVGADPRLKPFAPLWVREVIRFAGGFDASLVLYNTAGCSADRFSNTVPDRLISSVAAGVPIALPRSGYEACHEYLRDYPAVLFFGSLSELAEQLRDRPRVAELRAAGRAARAKYRAETEFERVWGLLDR